MFLNIMNRSSGLNILMCNKNNIFMFFNPLNPDVAHKFPVVCFPHFNIVTWMSTLFQCFIELGNILCKNLKPKMLFFGFVALITVRYICVEFSLMLCTCYVSLGTLEPWPELKIQFCRFEQSYRNTALSDGLKRLRTLSDMVIMTQMQPTLILFF